MGRWGFQRKMRTRGVGGWKENQGSSGWKDSTHEFDYSRGLEEVVWGKRCGKRKSSSCGDMDTALGVRNIAIAFKPLRSYLRA